MKEENAKLMQARESDEQEHKKEIASSEKYSQQLEQRLKDLTAVVKTKNSELKQFQTTLEGIEGLQKKAKQEIEKTKRERDEFKKQRD